MSEKVSSARGEPIEPQSSGSQSSETQTNADTTAADGLKVGPGQPPRDTRWKKGCASPNPSGRPRKEQSMLPDVRKAFEQALNKKVTVSSGDKKISMTRVEMGLEQLLNQFAKGDRYARRDLMEYAERLGIDFLAKYKQSIEEALTPDHQAILDSFLARRSGAGNESAPRVLAPPDLLDDDSVAPESAPAAKTEPKPASEPERRYKLV